MEISVEPSKTYAVTTSGSCTVTDADGLELCTASSGSQAFFVATTPTVTISDDGAKVSRATFNYALAALGLLGGGDKIPAEYIALKFLLANGNQWIVSPSAGSNDRGARARYSYDTTSGAAGWAFCAFSGGTSDIFGAMRTGVGMASPWMYGWQGVPSLDVGGEVVENGKVYEVLLNFKNDMRIRLCTPNGTYQSSLKSPAKQTTEPVHICAIANTPQRLRGRIYLYEETRGSEIVHSMLPAIDPTGAACMYDLVTRKAYKNDGTGQFVAGMTLAQARKLGKLPAGTTLTVSLPVGYDSDAGVVDALTQAEGKGCVLTIQTYESASAATTFALRRVWVRKTQAEYGNYVDAENTRWQVEWCVDVIGADPESLGYERYRSVDAAVAYWELVPYEHTEEELSTAE